MWKWIIKVFVVVPFLILLTFVIPTELIKNNIYKNFPKAQVPEKLQFFANDLARCVGFRGITFYETGISPFKKNRLASTNLRTLYDIISQKNINILLVKENWRNTWFSDDPYEVISLILYNQRNVVAHEIGHNLLHPSVYYRYLARVLGQSVEEIESMADILGYQILQECYKKPLLETRQESL